MAGMTQNSGQDRLMERVLLLRIRLFFRHAADNYSSAWLAVALIGATLFSNGVDSVLLYLWAGLAIGSVACIGITDRATGVLPELEEARRKFRLRMFLGTTMALVFGSSCFFLPADSGIAAELFLFVILSAIATVGCLVVSVFPIYYSSIAAGCLLPQVLSLTP